MHVSRFATGETNLLTYRSVSTTVDNVVGVSNLPVGCFRGVGGSTFVGRTARFGRSFGKFASRTVGALAVTKDARP